MSFTQTTNYLLEKVDIGTEIDLWGPLINANWDTVDGQMKTNALAAAAAAAAFTGDVTKAANGTVLTIAANAVTTAKILDDNVTNAKLANMAANTIKGTIAGGDPTDLTAANVLAITGAATTTQLTDGITKEAEVPKTATYVLTAAEAGKMVTFNSASAVSCTVNTGVFSADHRVDVISLGVGVVTFDGTATRLANPAGANKLTGRYSGATLWFVDASSYVLLGDIIP